ncbi:MAG: CRISPR-associated endonuclease Cas2 [Bacteroidetes bacterium]|nr:CRISPR-associated endonuclease Cas2 [Bacteroidota bacterium]MBK9633938.1 CRISPR-associated endonuclease Cas2 [Bacteroidota bacterium]
MVKKKLVIVAYDIAHDGTRTKVSKMIETYGSRINFSVFECLLSQKQFEKLQTQISKKIDIRTDQIVYYEICLNCYTKIIKQPGAKHHYSLTKVV